MTRGLLFKIPSKGTLNGYGFNSADERYSKVRIVFPETKYIYSIYISKYETTSEQLQGTTGTFDMLDLSSNVIINNGPSALDWDSAGKIALNSPKAGSNNHCVLRLDLNRVVNAGTYDFYVSNIGVGSNYGWDGETGTPYNGMIYQGATAQRPVALWVDGEVNIAPNTPPTNNPKGTSTNPAIISALTPTLDWSFSDPDAGNTQNAFQACVKRASDNAIVHDSGKVTGTATDYQVPSGVIAKNTLYYWQVMTWDNSDVASPWSSAEYFKLVDLASVGDKITFAYTGAAQIFTVPGNVTKVKIETWGAQGGNGLQASGGKGGYAAGELSVTPGETLNVYVGGKGLGSENTVGVGAGWNGGGNRLNNGSSYHDGGAGGGASDVRRNGTALTNRVIVAGGGGGAGQNGSSNGGAGGGTSGKNGVNGGGGTIGTGGTQSAGGTNASEPSANGSLGIGGAAFTQSLGWHPGAGGGGYYGGAGGYATSSTSEPGGGGGSSYIGGVTNGVTYDGDNATYGRTGDGQVIITVLAVSSQPTVINRDPGTTDQLSPEGSGLTPTFSWDYSGAFTQTKRQIKVYDGNTLVYDTGLSLTDSKTYTIPSNVLSGGKVCGWELIVSDAMVQTKSVLTTPTTVVASNYLTHRNARPQYLSNGWIVIATRQTIAGAGNSRLNFYVSKDFGLTFTPLCYSTNVDTEFAMTSKGTKIYLAYKENTAATAVHFNSFDATTVTNTDIVALKLVISVDQVMGAVDIGFSPYDGYLYIAFSSKVASLPNSFNIRHAVSVNDGGTWSVSQVTKADNSTFNATNPILVFTSGTTHIIHSLESARYDDIANGGFTTGSAIGILKNGSGLFANVWVNGPWTAKNIYYQTSNSYVQSKPNAVKSSDGKIKLVWSSGDNLDSNALGYSETTDGATWTARTKITGVAHGSLYDPAITTDKNNKAFICARNGNNGLVKRTYEGTTLSTESVIVASGVNSLSICANYNNFTEPLTVWQDASSVKFRGEWQVATGSEYPTSRLYFITNNLPSALIPLSPVDTYRAEVRPTFECEIGADVEGDKQNFVIQIAKDSGFTSGLQERTTETALTGWEVDNGTGWEPKPDGGVDTTFEGGKVHYTWQADLTRSTNSTDYYYWRMAPIDATTGARGNWSTTRRIRVGNKLQFRLKTPITTSEEVHRLVMNMVYNLPTDGTIPAELKIEICNNALDASPTWEDATSAFLLRDYKEILNRVKTAVDWALDVRITVTANDSLDPIEIDAFGISFD